MPYFLGEKDGANSGELALVTKNNLPTSKLTFQRVYQVIADDANQSEALILSTTGIPALYQKVSYAYCVKKSGQEVATVKHPVTGILSILWEVTCDFDSNLDAEEAEKTPTEKKPKIRWYGQSIEEVLEKDVITGKPITTVPGEQILITYPVAIAILEVKRFENYPFSPDTIFEYQNTTNSEPFYGAPIGTALMLPIEAEETIIDGERYIASTYRIQFKLKKNSSGAYIQDTWLAEPLHQGTKYFPHLVIGSGDQPPAQVAADAYGNPTTVNLSETGLKLPPGFPPVFLKFNKHRKVDFNLLSLGPY